MLHTLTGETEMLLALLPTSMKVFVRNLVGLLQLMELQRLPTLSKLASCTIFQSNILSAVTMVPIKLAATVARLKTVWLISKQTVPFWKLNTKTTAKQTANQEPVLQLMLRAIP